MNLANRLTLARLLLVPFFLIFTILDNVYTRTSALLIFIAGGLTDLFDGYIARKRKTVTTLGTFLDPLVDKLFISTAFICFVQLEEVHVPAWMVVLIISREFLITGLRTLAASQGKVLAAERAGKFKTTSQVICIIVIMVILIVNSVLERSWGISKDEILQSPLGTERALGRLLDVVPYLLTFVTTVLTIISGYAYLKKHRNLFLPAG